MSCRKVNMGADSQKKTTDRRSWVRMALPYLPKLIRHRLIRKMVTAEYSETPQLEMRIARTKSELEQAYRILHDSYVDQKYMQPDPTGMRIIKYFALPSTTTLIAVWDGKVVGTMSIIRKTSFGLPLENIFNIDDLTANDAAIAEVSSLAIAKEFRFNRGALFFPFCKFFFEYSEKYLRLQRIVIAVNPTMRDFYEGVLGFEEIHSKVIARYDFANGNPAVGLWADYSMLRTKIKKWYGHKDKAHNLYYFFTEHVCNFIKYPKRSFIKATDPVMSSEYLDYFFAQKSNVLDNLAVQERQALESIYPQYFLKRKEKLSSDNRSGPRFLVEAEGHINDVEQKKVRIIDVSEFGVRMQLGIDEYNHMQRCGRQEQEISVTVKITESHYSKVSGTICWSDEANLLIGLQLQNSDQQWSRYINYLMTDLNLKAS